MELSTVMGFATASLLLAMMPGPDNIFVLTESLSRGFRTGITITLGLVSGVLIHTLVAASGLSLVLISFPAVFSAIKYAGALYLLYLAYQAYLEKPIAINQEKRELNSGYQFGKLWRKGFFMNVLNPKVTLFFMAFLPQFIISGGYSPWIQMALLGILFMLISFLVFGTVSYLAGRLTQLLNTPTFWKYTKVVKIISLSILAIFLGFF